MSVKRHARRLLRHCSEQFQFLAKVKCFNDFSTRDFCSEIEKSSDAKFEGGIIIVGVRKEEIEICRDTGSYELLG